MVNKIIRLPRKIVITFIKLYQRFISPLLGNNCRFVPSCSEYTRQAVDKYGIIKGSFKGLKRILKCHPFSDGGYDPLK